MEYVIQLEELLKNVANSEPTNEDAPLVGKAGQAEVNSNKHLGFGTSLPEFLYLKEIEIEPEETGLPF